MRLNDAGRMFAGSVVIYAVVAACGAQDGQERPPAAPGSGGEGGVANGSGTAGTGPHGGQSGSIVDSMMNPVRDASAALPPDVVTEPCNRTIPVGDAGYGYVYAEHSYPGKSRVDLSALRVIGHLTPTSRPIAYEYGVTLAFVEDGRAAVFCGVTSSLNYDSVSFVLPSL